MDKKWYLSKTIWGVVISVVGKLVAVGFGVEVNEQDAAQLTDAVVALVGLGGSLVGDVLAIYGRSKVGK